MVVLALGRSIRYNSTMLCSRSTVTSRHLRLRRVRKTLEPTTCHIIIDCHRFAVHHPGFLDFLHPSLLLLLVLIDLRTENEVIPSPCSSRLAVRKRMNKKSWASSNAAKISNPHLRFILSSGPKVTSNGAVGSRTVCESGTFTSSSNY